MTRVLSLTTTAWRSFYESQVQALRQAGVTVSTLEPPNEFRAFDDDIRTRGVTDYLRFYGQVLGAVRSRYDLVHANYGLTAPIALAQPRRPVVLSLWGGEFVDNRYARLIDAATQRADEVIVPSAAMANQVDRDAHVIPYPVDTETFRPMDREVARDRIGWDTDERVVLFPSAKARPEKNYALARRVVDRLDEDVTLRTVVNEPYAEMPYYLNASDAVIVTSTHESGPMVVKEALACRVPVVSTPVGFVPDTLDGIADTRVAADEDGLVDGLRSVIGGRSDGRSSIRRYGTDDMAARLVRVYELALARRGRSPITTTPVSGGS